MSFYKWAFRPLEQIAKMKNAEKAAAQWNNIEVVKEIALEPTIIDTPVVEETIENTETPVLTLDEMKLKLDEAWISYHHASGLPKLTELMIQNGLM